MSDQRFEAAKAAMQALIQKLPEGDSAQCIADWAVQYADALLAELAKPCRGPDQAAPQGSAPDALLLARLEAAERVCAIESSLRHWTIAEEERRIGVWLAAKAAHEALPGAGGAT